MPRWRQRRLWLLFLLSLLALSMLGLRCGWLQVVDHTRLARAAVAQRAQVVPLGPSRGGVLDRHGNSLTGTTLCYRVAVYPGLVPAGTAASATLAQALGRAPEAVDRLLQSTDLPVFVADGLDAETAAVVAALGLEGVAVVADERRYGADAVARHVVGYVQTGGVAGGGGGSVATAPVGADGLEKAWDAYLRGTGPDYLALFMDGRGRPLTQLGWRKLHQTGGSSAWVDLPCDLVTTIDRRVQEVVEQVLRRRVARGAVVVVEPRSGDILAMASRPDFSPGDLARYLELPGAPLVNRALVAYPPGSVYKPVVLAAALESGAVPPDEWFVCDGSETAGGRELGCWARDVGGHGRVTPGQALAVSCNDVLVQIWARLEPGQVAEWAARFGFGRPSGLGLPGEATGNLGSVDTASAPEQAFGQGELEVTPLEVARFYAAIANRGLRPRLRLADELVAPNGARAVVGGLGAGGERVLSPFTALEVTRGLALAVTQGTGRAAAVVDGVAGKTGTAETGRHDAAGRPLYHGWFAGFWPTLDPRLVIVVLAEDTPVGGAAAAEVFGEILAGLVDIPISTH